VLLFFEDFFKLAIKPFDDIVDLSVVAVKVFFVLLNFPLDFGLFLLAMGSEDN